MEKEARKKEKQQAIRIKNEEESSPVKAANTAHPKKRPKLTPSSSLSSSTQPLSKKNEEEDVKNSVYFRKRIQVAVSVLPAAMGNIAVALEDAVRLMLLKYTDQVGILLTFENIQVIGNGGHGMVLDEIPYLHYKIAFDGLVFCPRVGSQVRMWQSTCAFV